MGWEAEASPGQRYAQSRFAAIVGAVGVLSQDAWAQSVVLQVSHSRGLAPVAMSLPMSSFGAGWIGSKAAPPASFSQTMSHRLRGRYDAAS